MICSVPEPDESPPDVRRLEPAERDRALTTVVAAFENDPLLRWVWPEDGRYASCAPGFFGLLLDLRRAGGEVWAASGGAAVAMWDPPGGLYRRPAEDPWPALQETFTDGERARWVDLRGAAGRSWPLPALVPRGPGDRSCAAPARAGRRGGRTAARRRRPDGRAGVPGDGHPQ